MKQEEEKAIGVPENAFRELKPGEVYNPLMSPDKKYPEVNLWSVLWGIAMAVLFSAAAAYLGLKVGQVFEAAIPIAIIAVGVSGAAKRKNALGENVIIQSFGTFSENNPVVSCTFTFTNVGDAPLVIHQAVASCGCTVPEYTQEPVMPGKTGTIKITYNGTGKYPGHFKKSITLRTNAKTEMMRLFVEGDMTAKDAK